MADPISGLLGLAGGIAGDAAAGSDRGHAQDLLDQAIAAYKNVNVPTNLSDLINYQQYQNAGQLDPSQEQAISAGPSAAGAVKADPKMVAAQMQALNALQGLSQTGMSSTDRARMNQIQQQMATQAEGQKQQIMQNFQQRGEGGSGNELLAQLTAGQNASNQANQQGLGAAGQAQQAALQALNAYGQNASNLENQTYNQQAQSGQANDLNTRFNVQNQQAQQARNVASQNAAKSYNLQNQQNLSNANTGLSNTALNQQRAGEQQTFSDQMSKANGMSGADFTGANAYNNMGNQQAQKWANIGQGVGNIFSGAGGVDGISSMFGGGGSGGASSAGSSAGGDIGGSIGGSGGALDGMMVAANGGTVPRYASGGTLLDPSLTVGPKPPQPQPQQGGGGGMNMASMLPMLAMLAAHGGKVPGQGEVPGDSYANDKVPAMLSPHEVVLPRSITMHQNAPEMAKLFMENEMRKQGRLK